MTFSKDNAKIRNGIRLKFRLKVQAMSGHSKWSTIKHQKGVTDARRGQLFTKLAREITVAARQGDPNPDMNVRLRLAVQKARDNNMPLDNIERAIKRGSGGSDGGGDALFEATYEGYGPGGVAIMLHTLSDNKNRTSSDVRSTFTKGGGSLGEVGCVAWNFESRGVITAEVDPDDGEDMALVAIDAGAEDFQLDGAYLEIYAGLETFDALRKALGRRRCDGHVSRAFHGPKEHELSWDLPRLCRPFACWTGWMSWTTSRRCTPTPTSRTRPWSSTRADPATG